MPNFGFVSPIRVKNGSTDFTIASSTGGLYHQGVVLPASTLISPLANVTWPTTGAQTLVNTTSVQSLTNKTINNITITDPGASATLTISSGGTLEAIGVFQHKFTSTANSAVTMPPATDALLMWTTEVDAKITAKTSQINVLGVVTWPSTTAQTLVNTTGTQALTNKTINNITITDPGTAATLTITSGGTLEAIGAFQHKFTSTADSAVTMPPATDALLMWTTEIDGKITAKTSQINVLGVVTWPTTSAQTLVNTTDAQTLVNKTWGAGSVHSVETLVCSSDGVTPSTAVAYGITRITANTTGGDFSTSPRLVSLAAPIVGMEKTIVFESTAAAVNTLDVDLGIGVGVDGSTSNRYIAFSSLATLHQSVTLMGMTTAFWAVKNVNSTVGQWGAATGIRSETAARTS